jgi:hypothetical protein
LQRQKKVSGRCSLILVPHPDEEAVFGWMLNLFLMTRCLHLSTRLLYRLKYT